MTSSDSDTSLKSSIFSVTLKMYSLSTTERVLLQHEQIAKPIETSIKQYIFIVLKRPETIKFLGDCLTRWDGYSWIAGPPHGGRRSIIRFPLSIGLSTLIPSFDRRTLAQLNYIALSQCSLDHEDKPDIIGRHRSTVIERLGHPVG